VSLAAARMLGPVQALPAEADGNAVVTPLGRFERPGEAAGDRQLLVRPQDVRLAEAGVPATVVALRFAGSGTGVTVDLSGGGGHRLTVIHTGPAPAIGQPVFVALEAGQVVIVPACADGGPGVAGRAGKPGVRA
jgi:hypothetical protein